MSTGAMHQLRRILTMLPQISDDRHYTSAEIAELTGIEMATILRDLRDLTARFDAPGGFVEGVQFYVESDRISLTTNLFRRPMRLTIDELHALDIGLAMLMTERSPAEHRAIDNARERLREALARIPSEEIPEARHAAATGAHANPEHLTLLGECIRGMVKVRLEYQSGGSSEVTTRLLWPYGLVVSSGAWYLLAHCELNGDIRRFRLDRMSSLEPLPDSFEYPVGFSVDDAVAESRVFNFDGASMMTVRYSPQIARWIAEREGGDVDADGGFILKHPLADAEWGVRHVLQYGAEAEVLEPAEVREEVIRRLQSMAT